MKTKTWEKSVVTHLLEDDEFYKDLEEILIESLEKNLPTYTLGEKIEDLLTHAWQSKRDELDREEREEYP